jgi:membrane protein DedA with SNARE-associated domain
MLEELLAKVMGSIAEGQWAALITLSLISALMEVGLPFPFVLDTALLVAGFEAGLISFEVLFLMIALFLGRLIGSSALFWLSRLLGGVFIRWLEKRSSSLPGKITILANKFRRHVPVAIALARFTPGLLTASSVVAGVIRVNYWYFVLGIALSSLLADVIILVLGFLTLHGLKLLGITPTVWQLVIGLMLLISLGWGVFYLIRRRRQPGTGTPVP